MEFLVHIDVHLPTEWDERRRSDLLDRERRRGEELIASGALRAIWRKPGRLSNASIYRVSDADELHAALVSLPLFPWVTITVEPLSAHPLGAVESRIISGTEPAS